MHQNKHLETFTTSVSNTVLVGPIRFNTMTIAALFLWRTTLPILCDKSMEEIINWFLSPFIQFGTMRQRIIKDSILFDTAGVFIFLFMHHAYKCMCVHIIMQLHEWVGVCVTLLASLGFHNAHVQNAPTKSEY